MSKLRLLAHQKGYAIRYTFGITDTMTIYPWKGTGKAHTIDMSDPIKGKRRAEETIKNL